VPRVATLPSRYSCCDSSQDQSNMRLLEIAN
jgi:hypothetical protein